MARMKWQFLLFLFLGAVSVSAQAPPAVRLSATSMNVSGAGEPIKINISSWSTDAQKQEMIAAWTLANPKPAEAAAGRGGRGGRGAGGAGARGRGARGPAPAGDLPADPDDPDADNPAFRFGRGGARGAAEAAPISPEASLAAALKKAPTIGVIWTSETVGYSVKYACREQQPDGTERIILATDRRVGAWSTLWKPSATASGPAMDYPFSIIELRLNPKGEGEGRGAIFGKVAIDPQAKTIALDGYSALPVILKSVKKL
jgi:hypothetical protein